MAANRAASQPAACEATATESLDFCAPLDDAWYAVRLRLEEDGVLRVMYCNFSDAYDERYRADGFGTVEELEEFRDRFRLTALQLQDNECRKVIEGMEVCACHAFGESDIRFYTAVVDAVFSSEHKFSEGESICTCTFRVLWQHGPMAGEKSMSGVENICLLQPRNVENQTLNCFLNIARRKLEGKGMFSNMTGVACPGGSSGSAVDHFSKKPPKSFLRHKEIQIPDSGDDLKHTSRGKICMQRNSILDKDSSQNNICCEECYHFCHIENLEKDLSSVTIMDFIHQQTSIFSHAVVFPCYWSKLYHMGTIFVKSKEHADKLLEFLCDPSHIIVSSGGRPWVTSAKWCGVNKGAMPKFEGQLKLKEKHSRELKLAYRGSKEYDKAKQLQSLHLDLHNHLENLHQRLTWEERKIMMDGDCN